MLLTRIAVSAAALLSAVVATADVVRTTANNGQLVMEDVPAIPAEVAADLNQYLNVRSAAVREWTADSRGLYVTTRFGDVSQLHRIDMPGGARRQLTFYQEPIGGVARQPGGQTILFTQDAGGSEFAQIFGLDPETGRSTMLTDGESRNGALEWDREGRQVAYQSTARNGASNDVWIMDPAEPSSARIVLESPDGSWWGPAEFSASGSQLLVQNYVSITDSRVHLIDLDTGEQTLLTGGDSGGGSNAPLAFDHDDAGYWLVTDQSGEFKQLAWQPLEAGAPVEIVTADLPWDISLPSLPCTPPQTPTHPPKPPLPLQVLP
ncbi:MAG: hypothetical protein AAGA61_10690 [Pseudomonadota bacterium]